MKYRSQSDGIPSSYVNFIRCGKRRCKTRIVEGKFITPWTSFEHRSARKGVRRREGTSLIHIFVEEGPFDSSFGSLRVFPAPVRCHVSSSPVADNYLKGARNPPAKRKETKRMVGKTKSSPTGSERTEGTAAGEREERSVPGSKKKRKEGKEEK